MHRKIVLVKVESIVI